MTFLMVKELPRQQHGSAPSVPPMIVVVNWLEELKARLGQ
jgi:hypothetical protein